MSLGSDKAKIALEENGEIKFLKNIVRDPVSYDLTTEEDAEELTVDEVMIDIKALKDTEPDKMFVVRA